MRPCPWDFADSDGSLMEREMRNVHYSSNSTLEKVVLEELIKGPGKFQTGRLLLPPETKVLSVQKDGSVCTVNFDAGFNDWPLPQSPMCPQRPVFMRWWMTLTDAVGVREADHTDRRLPGNPLSG